MRLFIDDLRTFPDAAPQQINDAFDAFEATLERYKTLAEQIGDLDCGVDLRKREIVFTGFLELPDGEPPHYYVQKARTIMGSLAASLVWEWGLPYGSAGNRMEIRAEDGSFSAVSELTYQVPAR